MGRRLDSPIQGVCGDLRWNCRFRDVWGRVLLSLKNACVCACTCVTLLMMLEERQLGTLASLEIPESM